ncbi:MAG: 7-cyano-7-deazaguanine synthase [bacterium]
MKELKTNKICTRSVFDETVPGITFNEKGEANFCNIHDKLTAAYPRGEEGKQEWLNLVNKIKTKGKNKKYDCIIGVSGGTDSCYLLHLAKEYGLKPLAVNLDNGWNSEIAVENIKKVISKLDIDLETYVIDYEEIKDILHSYMKASLPWIDTPTDLAITSILYKIANSEGLKHILVGNDFRTEGKQPIEWTYGDTKQLKIIQKLFGRDLPPFFLTIRT